MIWLYDRHSHAHSCLISCSICYTDLMHNCLAIFYHLRIDKNGPNWGTPWNNPWCDLALYTFDICRFLQGLHFPALDGDHFCSGNCRKPLYGQYTYESCISSKCPSSLACGCKVPYSDYSRDDKLACHGWFHWILCLESSFIWYQNPHFIFKSEPAKTNTLSCTMGLIRYQTYICALMF